MHPLTADDLLSGAAATYEVVVPPEVLKPGQEAGGNGQGYTVTLRPITIGSFQLITKAARQDPGLMPLLMIKESLVNPEMSLAQVRKMHMGLVEFLIQHIRRISGLSEKKSL
ncbi:MAG: hypothetical protein AAGI38_06070 [Bacteroidota bacterium]